MGQVWASLVAQTVKNLPTMLETQVQSMSGEDSLEKGTSLANGAKTVGKSCQGLGLGSWDRTQLARGHWDGAGRRGAGSHPHWGNQFSLDCFSGPGGWEAAWLPFFPRRTRR